MSLLKIKYNTDLFDFQKEGQRERKFGIPKFINTNFISWNWNNLNGSSITTASAFRIKILANGDVQILETINILALLPTTFLTGNYSRIGTGYGTKQLSEGLWYLYFSDGTYNYKSEIFYNCNEEPVDMNNVFMVTNGGGPEPFLLSGNKYFYIS